MNLFDVLKTSYDTFVGYFPPQLQWLITLLIVIGIVGGLIRLVIHNVMYLILVIVLLPFVLPVLSRFTSDLHGAFAFIIQLVGFAGPHNQR